MKNMSQWFPRAYLCSNLGRTPATQNFCQLLSFGCAFLKFNSISLFVFFGEFYRVSLDPVIFCGACGAPITRPGGRATLSCPPGPRLAIAKFWHCLHLSYTV